MYGAIAKDSKQFFRTYDRFDAPTFVEYLKAMQKYFGKVAAVVDKASPIGQNWSGSYCGKTRTLVSYTSQRDPRTSARLRNAGTKENGSCLSQNIIGRLSTCAMQLPRTTEP